MTAIDEFASTLLEESKRFLELSQECSEDSGQIAELHAALMLGFCSLEAYVSAISDDFLETAGLSEHDKGILLQREVRLDSGKFKRDMLKTCV